jgi:hypothetical protein
MVSREQSHDGGFSMINRRRFLSTGMIGAGLAGTSGLTAASMIGEQELAEAPNIFDEKWSRAKLQYLGIPRSWWYVHRGLHPFSPERVLIIGKRPAVWTCDDTKARIMERRYGKAKSCSEQKLDYALWIMNTLASHYGVPAYYEDWATRLVTSNTFDNSFGLGNHWGMVARFQERGDRQPVQTHNGLVDWWLFLIPDGVDVQRYDGQPTHVLFGCVDASGSRVREMVCLCYIAEVAKNLRDVVALSRMDRFTAARHLNRQLLEVLGQGSS